MGPARGRSDMLDADLPSANGTDLDIVNYLPS